MAHWDGFQPSRSTYKSCWTLEATILNSKKDSGIPPLPLVFIPLSSTKLYKKKGNMVLNSFLKPFVEEMKTAYVEGFPVKYNYPPEKIHPSLELGMSRYTLHLHSYFYIHFCSE